MNGKQQILTTLREDFSRWEELLASMSEEQITAPQLPSNLSIKDVIAHLRAWQQRSIARLEAAVLNRNPSFPGFMKHTVNSPGRTCIEIGDRAFYSSWN